MTEINNTDFVARTGPTMIISTQNLGLFMNFDKKTQNYSPSGGCNFWGLNHSILLVYIS